MSICTVDETQLPPDIDETYVEGYTQDEGMVWWCKNFYTAECMMLIAGEGNDGQDLLSTGDVTVSTPTAILLVAHLLLVLLLCPVAVLQPHHLEMTCKAKERVMVNIQLTNNVIINYI